MGGHALYPIDSLITTMIGLCSSLRARSMEGVWRRRRSTVYEKYHP